MFGNYYYHEKIRRLVSVFGALFNDIYVKHTDASGKVISQTKVPLSYAPKHNFLERIKQTQQLDDNDRGEKVAIKLPRMSFELLSFTFDSQRQLPRNNTIGITQEGNNLVRTKFTSPVPYVFDFQLSIFAKNQDEALQIVEQIIPYFSPVYNLVIKPLEDYPEVKEEIPIILDSITFEDTYEQPIQLRRAIVYSLSFEMRSQFYGPISEQGIIRTANVNFLNYGDSDASVLTRLSIAADSDTAPCIECKCGDFGFTKTILVSGDPSTYENV